MNNWGFKTVFEAYKLLLTLKAAFKTMKMDFIGQKMLSEQNNAENAPKTDFRD